MVFGYEGPLLRAHQCRHMTGRDQRVESRLLGFQQHRHRGPCQPPADQQRQVVGEAFLDHGGDRSQGRLEADGMEHHRPTRVLAGNADGVPRRCDRPHFTACRARLIQRTDGAARYIDRNSQHVPETGQDDPFVQREPDRLIDVLLRADADRTSGPRDQPDVVGKRRAQTGHRNRPLVSATDVHDPHRAGQRERADGGQLIARGAHRPGRPEAMLAATGTKRISGVAEACSRAPSG